MPRRAITRPTPPSTAARGHAFRTTEAIEAGHTDWSTRSARMLMPTRGVRVLTPPLGIAERAAAFALALPDDVVFSHTTAAHLWGLPLPRALEGEQDLHVMRRTARPAIERAGCVSHRGAEGRQITRLGGLRVTSLADTWCDLIEVFHRRLRMADAVMLGDAAVERLQPTQWLDEVLPQADPSSELWWSDPAVAGIRPLRERLIARRTFRGRRLAREALRLVRPRVWSPMETHSRLVTVDAGLPEPELNVRISHRDGGGFIGFGDLVWRRRTYRRKVVGEYNGATHERLHSRDSDHTRRLQLEDDDWKLLEIYSRHIFTPAGRFELVSRLRSWL